MLLFVQVELHSEGTSVGEDGGGGEDELHRGASRRGGSGLTAAYHYVRLLVSQKSKIKKVASTHVATFFAFAGIEIVSVPSPTYNIIICERDSAIR